MCGQRLPIQYVNNYDEQPPTFVQVLGWTGVGKTVFLQAMTLMLKRMGHGPRDSAARGDLACSLACLILRDYRERSVADFGSDRANPS